MVVFAIIIGLIFMLIGSVIVCFSCKGEPSGYCGTLLIIIGTSMVFIVALGVKPSAMDVYKGKTTLEITYRDGVAIDSVVVYKDR